MIPNAIKMDRNTKTIHSFKDGHFRSSGCSSSISLLPSDDDTFDSCLTSFLTTIFRVPDFRTFAFRFALATFGPSKSSGALTVDDLRNLVVTLTGTDWRLGWISDRSAWLCLDSSFNPDLPTLYQGLEDGVILGTSLPDG